MYKGFIHYFKDSNKDVWTKNKVEYESKGTTVSCTVAINKNL